MEPEDAGRVILETLTLACSQDPTVLTPAEHQLQQWQTQPGFYSTLSVNIGLNYESVMILVQIC